MSRPKFDQRSRIFELDACDGYGKVCLVYHNTKQGELNTRKFEPYEFYNCIKESQMVFFIKQKLFGILTPCEIKN